MRLIGLRLVAAISILLIAAGSLRASTSPRYGGTLHVELQAAKVSFDPREWKEGSLEFARDEKMAALVFDRLIALDNYGRFQPQLATEWLHDAGFKRWQFTLRTNVKFSDGTALGAGDVVAALQPLLPSGQQISANGSGVVIQSSAAMPDLLEELAWGRFFVYRVQADGTLLGTGAFFVTEPPANSIGEREAGTSNEDSGSGAIVSRSTSKASRLRFHANENNWAGRPFLDAIDVTLNVPPLRALFDLQLGKADLVELSPELVRRATQENLRVWTSAPTTLFGLRFDDRQAVASEPKLREALALSLDRQTIAGVLLQKQAEPASALLPQWLSGYAFLFTMETNLDRAKEIRASLPLNSVGITEPLRLRLDAAGDLAKLLGERVAVNARQASIVVQLQSHLAPRTVATSSSVSGEAAVGLHLFAWHYSSLSPRVELESFLSTLHLADPAAGSFISSTDPEQLYARERHILEDRRVLPLVAIPEFVGIGMNVHDWMPTRWGEWRLADVWLDTAAPAQNSVPGARP